MRNRWSIEQIIQWIEARDMRGLAAAISIVENDLAGKRELLAYAFQKGRNDSVSLGFTGAPGAGKSTLINGLIKNFRAMNKTVGVLAVDPTSPFSCGAVLGDRVRMREHAADSGIFIRSLASRGALGGLSEATKLVLYLYKAYRFDVIIIETVGVGQDEIDVSKYADVTTVLLAPGLGDAIQMSKAGIMEIADLFVINKYDRPEADVTRRQLENALAVLAENNRPPVVCTIADRGEGIDELASAIETVHRRVGAMHAVKYRNRLFEEIRSSAIHQVNREIRGAVSAMTEEVLRGRTTPIEAAAEIVEKYKRGC